MLDLLLWNYLGVTQLALRIGLLVVVFIAFCWVLMAAGISPLQLPLLPEDEVYNMLGTVLVIAWWLFAARIMTVILSNGLTSNIPFVP